MYIKKIEILFKSYMKSILASRNQSLSKRNFKMSFRNNNKQVSNKKPFCKVCQDAGKPESEYSSHYVRSMPDKSGKTTVTCPTLLATECRFCYKLGHTTKFCPVIEANKKSEEKASKQQAAKAIEQPKKQEQKAKSNAFAAFDDSSDEEKVATKVSIKVSKQVIEEFPSLGSTVKPAASLSGWAAVTAKTATQYENEKYEQELIAKTIKRSLPPLAKKTVVIPQAQVEKKSWADWSDEDDEEVAPTYAKVAPMKFSAADLDWAARDSDSDEDW
jgi:hypothetical protein